MKSKMNCQLHEQVPKDCRQLLKPWLVNPGSVPIETHIKVVKSSGIVDEVDNRGIHFGFETQS